MGITKCRPVLIFCSFFPKMISTKSAKLTKPNTSKAHEFLHIVFPQLLRLNKNIFFSNQFFTNIFGVVLYNL